MRDKEPPYLKAYNYLYTTNQQSLHDSNHNYWFDTPRSLLHGNEGHLSSSSSSQENMIIWTSAPLSKGLIDNNKGAIAKEITQKKDHAKKVKGRIIDICLNINITVYKR